MEHTLNSSGLTSIMHSGTHPGASINQHPSILEKEQPAVSDAAESEIPVEHRVPFDENAENVDSDNEQIYPSLHDQDDYHTETETETDDTLTEEEEEKLDKRYNIVIFALKTQLLLVIGISFHVVYKQT